MRDLDMQEVVDQMSLNTLQYGTGYTKIIWDKESGDIVDFNEETMEVDMSGDFHTYAPNTEDVWLDSEAKRKQDIRYTFERVIMPVDEACFKYPEHAAMLKEQASNQNSSWLNRFWNNTSKEAGEDKIAIYEYWEKAAPVNGMAGRWAIFLEDYNIIQHGKNPHYKHGIPHHVFTYIDVPGQVYGKSVVEYVSRLQEMLNRLDSSVLDAIQAHGIVRMVLPAGAEIEDEAISNSNWDYLKISGNIPPHFINPPQLMPDIWRHREQIVLAIQELYGVNDSMLGIQRREQSAISQQTAIESGTMMHRRLFKKYSMVVEGIYKDFLGLVRENWDEPRTILVLGKEKAFEAADLKGADIAGGFDIVVEYGTSLPLDPNMRRESIMLLMPVLKEAGMSEKQILKLMKLNDLEGMYDRMEMAGDRQREIFEEMIAKAAEGFPEYIAPADLEDHAARLEYAYDFLETSEFKYLPIEAKDLIRKHVKEREQLAADQATPDQDAGGGRVAMPAGMPGVGGAQAPEMATSIPGMPM
jgi:hypothetical protein